MHRRRRRRHSHCHRRSFLRLLGLVRSRIRCGQSIEEASGGRLACAWTVEQGEAGAVTAAPVGEELSLPGPVRRVGAGPSPRWKTEGDARPQLVASYRNYFHFISRLVMNCYGGAGGEEVHEVR